MAKRTATSELNHDNYLVEDEPEEMGMFKKASSNELKMRSMKRAKRRGGVGNDVGPSVFKDFKAFAAPTSLNAPPPNFSFLAEGMKPTLPAQSAFPSFSFSNTASPKVSKETNKSTLSSPNITKPSLPITNKKLESENESCKKTTGFKFGLDNDTSVSTSPSPTVSFSFTSPKNTSLNSSFKFTLDNSAESNAKQNGSMFSCGVKSSSEYNKFTNSNKPEVNDTKTTNKLVSIPSQSQNPIMNGTSSPTDRKKDFLSSLKNLNKSLLSWVLKHMEKNVYINLNPIFDDYKKHIDELYRIRNSDPEKNSVSNHFSSSNNDTTAKPDFLKNSSSFSFSSSKPSEVLINNKSPLKDKEDFNSGSKENNSTADKTISSKKDDKFSFGLSDKLKADSALNFGGSKNKLQTESDSSGQSGGNSLFSFGATSNISINSFSFGNAKESSPHKEKKPESSTEAPGKPVFSFDSSKDSSSKPAFSFGVTDKEHPPSSFSFGNTGARVSSNSAFGGSTTSTGSFTFGSSTSTFSFGANSTSTSGFSFGGLKDTKPCDSQTNESGDKPEEPYEPPKVEVQEVKEDDAVYEKKVKLFYKKDDQYVDKGVGTLYLKPAGEKFQLIVRAQNNLGTILLNILLNSSLPTQRVGKNNVLLVCVPNPPYDTADPSAPMSLLIRVKTGEDADELLAKIDENK